MNIPDYVASKRSGYAKLPIIVRAFIVVIAFIIGLVGLVLVFTPPPLFDVGVLLLFLSLSILSFQFTWAHAALVYLTRKLADKAFRKKLFIFIGALFVIFFGFVVLVFV